LFGIGESLVDERLKDLIEAGDNPTIGLLAHTQIGEIHVRLTAKATDPAHARELNAALEAKIRERLGEFIFGTDEQTYEGILSGLLMKADLTLAVAETAFGSSAIQTLKLMEGSDRYFRLGVTVPDRRMARELFPIAAKAMRDDPWVSEATARALAEGVRDLAGTDFGLGITGLAGVGKDRDHLIYIALAASGATTCVEQRWPSAMRFIENRMTKTALSRVMQRLSR
jgi:nicotinamide-nucleotide amidase